MLSPLNFDSERIARLDHQLKTCYDIHREAFENGRLPWLALLYILCGQRPDIFLSTKALHTALAGLEHDRPEDYAALNDLVHQAVQTNSFTKVRQLRAYSESLWNYFSPATNRYPSQGGIKGGMIVQGSHVKSVSNAYSERSPSFAYVNCSAKLGYTAKRCDAARPAFTVASPSALSQSFRLWTE